VRSWAAQLAVVVLVAGLLAAGETQAPEHGRSRHSIGKAAPGVKLRSLASKVGLSLGATVSARVLAEGDPRYSSAAARNFNTVTVGEMRWAYTQARRGHFDFSAAESVVRFAERHHMAVRGHNLLWFDENPAWLEKGRFTRKELTRILRRHIRRVVGHFRGRVDQWDVVNEPLDSDGRLRDSVWLRVIGPSYIAKALRWAHRADPHAQLFINEFGVEAPGPKLDAMVAVARHLVGQGVPLDGIGFQGHFGLGGTITKDTASDLKASMGRFDGLHLATAVTELDVALPEPPSHGDLVAQAKVFGRALRACLAVASCRTVVVWGIYDGHSWVPSISPGQGAALLLDDAFRRKPAYAKWIRILSKARHQ
jgi:endo-1,4-beta-xylanase